MKENSKVEIKNRMLKKAAALWGVPASEIDMSFDPIISLLITACAAELEKISGEIDESQTRITEKIIQLMTPDTIFGARPAHAILRTEPVDDFLKINQEYSFTYKKKVNFKNTSINYKDVFFSPLQDFNVVKGTVKYIASGESINEIDNSKQINPIFTTNNSSLPSSTLYIGIESDVKSLTLKDVSLYFELLDIEANTLFYHYLKSAEWYINDTKIETTEGFFNSKKNSELNLEAIFSDASNKINNIVEKVRNNYTNYYTTVKDTTIETSTFKELEHIISENKVKIEDDIRWIKIVFPRVISNSMLQKTYCALNAFPAINRELNSFTYQLKEYINIIPVKTEDLFLDIHSIVNTSGKPYRLQSKDTLDNEKGTFTIRTENVGKLDHRKAKEYITHLIELLKDESASFSFYNNDFLHKNLKNLNQLIALLENKVNEMSHSITETNYVALKPYKKKDSLIIDYWSTNGNQGNNIKTGSSLKIYNGIGIKQKSSYLVTSTYGGKDDLSMNERLNAYRRSLLSRDRVVTKEDVKAVCYELYNDKVSNVNINKGYSTDIDLNKGLLQCINIELTPSKVKTEDHEWVSLNNNLLLYLEEHSVSIFPYKIKLV